MKVTCLFLVLTACFYNKKRRSSKNILLSNKFQTKSAECSLIQSESAGQNHFSIIGVFGIIKMFLQ